MKTYTLFKLIERVGARGWRGALESVRRLMGLLVRILYCVSGGPSKGYCIALYTMSKRIVELCRKSGFLFAGMYLKQVAFCLQWYIGGDRSVRPPMSVFVSLTRSGLPRFIPPIFRKRLRGNPDPVVIKIVLSVCTLSRIITILPNSKKYIDTSTIQPEVDHMTESVKQMCELIKKSAYTLVSRYSPNLDNIILELGYRFKPLHTAGPNSIFKPQYESYLSLMGISSYDKLSSCHTLPIDGGALIWWWGEVALMDIGHLWYRSRSFRPGEFIEPAGLGYSARNSFFSYLTLLSNSFVELYGDFFEHPLEMARLGRKIEGSGKVRVFVMGNPIVQTLLRPLHDWSMKVLSTLRCDGTFSQLSPLKQIIGSKDLSSFDLKSATDLLPAELLRALLVSIFGQTFAHSWFRLITNMSVNVPDSRFDYVNPRRTRFVRGQPLGFYSSWSLFTMVHHVLVWMAAQLVYPEMVFTRYAILGDDLVIADALVAQKYSVLLTGSGGVISKEKSLISRNGCCEFAKRFIIHNHRTDRKDVSPLSVPLIRATDRYVAPFVFSTLGAPLIGAFRCRGAGYKVFSRLQSGRRESDLFSSLSRRWQRMLVGMHSSSGILPLPVALWLTYPDYRVLDCYTLGLVYDYILTTIRPIDIDIESIAKARLLWPCESEQLFECHLNFLVCEHIKYVIWYANASVWRDLSLSQLLKPPVASHSLDRASERDKIQRYGPIYKMWDFCRQNRSINIPILDSGDRIKTSKDFVYLSIFIWRYEWCAVL